MEVWTQRGCRISFAERGKKSSKTKTCPLVTWAPLPLCFRVCDLLNTIIWIGVLLLNQIRNKVPSPYKGGTGVLQDSGSACLESPLKIFTDTICFFSSKLTDVLHFQLQRYVKLAKVKMRMTTTLWKHFVKMISVSNSPSTATKIQHSCILVLQNTFTGVWSSVVTKRY